jgi:xanthine dehydrogenase YagS FAD-binding subunit
MAAMRPFSYDRATDVNSVLAEVRSNPNVALLAGGTTQLDLMKLGVSAPNRLIDITPLAFLDPALAEVRVTPEGGVRIGSLATMSAVAEHPSIRESYPLVSEALLLGASAQLRNMATIGGNLLQRTRCVYFRDVSVEECNKRRPGSGCAARLGIHRNSAVLGTSDACIATHASDFAVALVATEGVIHVTTGTAMREIGADDFFLLPGASPERETEIAPAELIMAVELPKLPAGARSTYLKVRDRESYEFALVSVAAAVTISDGAISWVRLALGGVATKPWRATEAEQILIGKAPSEDLFAVAAEVALRDANPLPQNAFKVTLSQRAVQRALTRVCGADGAAE